jgi:phospholipase/carboxylesterase
MMQPMSTANLSLYYLIRQPEKPAPDGAKPPLLILLHGLRSNEEDLFSLTPYLDERFLIVSARAPYVLGLGQYAWYRVTFTPSGSERNQEDFECALEVLIRFVGEVVNAYGADPRQVYLMGFSQGAIMSVAALLTHPELLAGAVAMSGALPSEVLPSAAPAERLKDIPVIVVHGVYDDVLPIAEGRTLRLHLSTLPVRLDYREYPMRHQVSDESLDDVSGWLIEQLNQAQRASSSRVGA